MVDARVTRRGFLGRAAGVGTGAALAPWAVSTARAATAPTSGRRNKGLSHGGLLYLSPGEAAYRLDVIARESPGGWVRTDVNWGSIEASRGRFDWTASDAVIRGGAERGLGVIAVVGSTPRWANGGLGWNVPPFDPNSMRPFLRALADRYAATGAVFEIWNEPNYSTFWKWPDPRAYAALLRVAHEEIKGVDATATVVTGGLASGGGYDPVAFVRGIYAHGGAGSFDALGYHPYCGSSPPLQTGSGLYRTLDLHDVMVANGDGAKAVWGTEIGWRVQLFGVDENQQARYLSQSYALWSTWAAEGRVGPLLWYNLRDESVSPFDPHTFSGLYRNNWTARPSCGAFRNA